MLVVQLYYSVSKDYRECRYPFYMLNYIFVRYAIKFFKK